MNKELEKLKERITIDKIAKLKYTDEERNCWMIGLQRAKLIVDYILEEE